MGADDSDYGEELNWDDEELETQLTVIENAPAQPRIATRPELALVQVQVEGAEQVIEASEQSMEVPRQGESTSDALEALESRASAAGSSLSLWEKFRKRKGWGGLSVSDLVGPSWCEVQHSYRLSSKPHLPPNERPATIVTSTGASIPLNQKRTVAREVVLDKGRAVHKVLEKEAMGDAEEVKVAVGQKEEWWALRILNTIVCLETLIATGLTREIPVAGFVGPFLVFGVIDEIDRRQLTPVASTSTLSPRASTSKEHASTFKSASPTKNKEDGSQRKLNQYFPPSPTKKGKEKAVDQDAFSAESEEATLKWGFVVSDSKTRYNRSLPPKNESRASRLQLMLYHRLISSLLTSPSPATSPAAPTPFDWSRLFAHLSLDPSTPFTDAFLTSIQPVLVGSLLEVTLGSASTLAEFIAALQLYGEKLGAKDGIRGPFEQDLEINYRLRNNVRKWKPRKKSRKEFEEDDSRRAIEESLRAEVGRDNVATFGEDEEDLARALAMSMEQDSLAQGVQNVVLLNNDNPIEAAAGETLMDAVDVEVEAIPYVADVALRIPPSSTDPIDFASARFPPSASTDLPTNSQATPPSELRYNLRRRRSTTSALENINPYSPPASASIPLSKRHRPAPPPLSPSPMSTPPAPRAKSSSPPPSPPEEVLEGSLIGTEKFINDPEDLDAWLRDVTSLWMGEREPRGVSLEQTSRCRTCEFEEGCEWRQTKALEALEATRARNRALAEGKKA